MFKIENYIDELKLNFEKHNDELIENIKTIKSYNHYSKIELFDICVFIQPFDISIMLFSMDRGANEVFYEGNIPSIFSGSKCLIEDFNYYSVPDERYDEFWDFVESNDIQLEELETETILNWFLDCWKVAGGSDINIPSYFSFHDSLEAYDLQKDKWINDSERWSK